MSIPTLGPRIPTLPWQNDGNNFARVHVGPVVLKAGGVAHAHESEVETKVISVARTREDAKIAAEAELRAVYDALHAHFAPVLRWNGDTSTFLDWELNIGEDARAESYWWSVLLTDSADEDNEYGASGQANTDAGARRAAEAALRSLGVNFRVETGTP